MSALSVIIGTSAMAHGYGIDDFPVRAIVFLFGRMPWS